MLYPASLLEKKPGWSVRPGAAWCRQGAKYCAASFSEASRPKESSRMAARAASCSARLWPHLYASHRLVMPKKCGWFCSKIDDITKLYADALLNIGLSIWVHSYLWHPFVQACGNNCPLMWMWLWVLCWRTSYGIPFAMESFKSHQNLLLQIVGNAEIWNVKNWTCIYLLTCTGWRQSHHTIHIAWSAWLLWACFAKARLDADELPAWLWWGRVEQNPSGPSKLQKVCELRLNICGETWHCENLCWIEMTCGDRRYIMINDIW